jgi:hypothetical protein
MKLNEGERSMACALDGGKKDAHRLGGENVLGRRRIVMTILNWIRI